MKAKIIIEKFANGISLKWEGENHKQEAIVAIDYDREKAIGNMIWEDVKHIMDTELCNVVTINIEYGTGNTNQAVEADIINSLLCRK